MDFKKIIEDAKEALSQFKLKFLNTQQKFGSIMTDDGKTVTFDGEMLGMGMPVTIDGQPAPDGTYTLETGQILTVKNGMCDKIEDPTTPPANNMEEQFKAMTDKVAAFETKFTEIETKMSETTTKMLDMFTKMAEQLGANLDLIEKFSSQTEPPTEPPLNRKQIKIKSETDRLEVIKNALNKIKSA